MGDFNINLLEYDSHTPTTDFVNNFFHTAFFLVFITQQEFQNIEPLLLITFTLMVLMPTLQGGNILMQITDHFPQFLILKNAQVSHNKSESFKYDYSNFMDDKFLEEFNQTNFNYLENSDMDVNKKFDRLWKDLSTLTNKHQPIKKRSRNEMKLKDKPWINNRIQKMMRIHDRMLLKLKTTNDNLKLYKKFRNRVSNEIKKVRKVILILFFY